MKHAWKNQRVLVTGGTGFIGSFVVERLLAEGAIVRAPARAQNYRALSARRAEIEWMEGDLRDPAFCQELVAGVDRVLHMASCRRNVKYHQERAADVAEENVKMSMALIEALAEAPSVPVVFFSTANVPPGLDVLKLAVQETVDGYVLGKALCEALWSIAAHQHRFPLLILRPVGVYGPRDTFAEDGNVIPSLMMKARAGKEELRVWGTGDEERAFLYVEDLVEALFRLVAAGAQGVEYVTSGEVVTIRELVAQIRDLVRPGLPVTFETEKRLGARSLPLLPPHACLRSMRWTTLEEGLKRTYEYWTGKGAMLTNVK